MSEALKFLPGQPSSWPSAAEGLAPASASGAAQLHQDLPEFLPDAGSSSSLLADYPLEELRSDSPTFLFLKVRKQGSPWTQRSKGFNAPEQSRSECVSVCLCECVWRGVGCSLWKAMIA